MQIIIKRIDTTLPLPEYKTAGAVGFDLASREDITIPANSIGYAPLNVIIATPEGHMLMLAPRSSLHKRGLTLANAVGIIDQDFCGPEDELRAPLYNFTDADVVIARGDRIVQGVIQQVYIAKFTEVEIMEADSRGGFGTTGRR